ncbi:conserved membrane hypothetical protein [Candidatus Sulfotelmatobacter kueseliae]|uniref:Uncharacterized protein n=1 Tax=Candidatus Sulfotelmatobacter kueseliae TaxID=2042962 RepID=A0A2U3KJ33_9BACT|nr:conserved membrane hypothetical protein [Candidatus Sulfotelmatobacter kueseliae]
MPEPPQNPDRLRFDQSDWSARNLALIALLAVFAFLVMGYHPGLEDDAFYLAAIKKNLNPSLFPHDSDFFAVQFQATIFDKLIAWSVRLTHVPLAWAALIWQFAAIFLVLHGCWRISRRCFSDAPAQWAAVALIGALLTLPVSGTGINLADQYLHPRTLATAAILAAIVAVLDRRLWRAGILLAVAVSIHVIMAVFGISLCAFLLWSQRTSFWRRQSPVPAAAAVLFPLSWMFDPGSDAWRQAASSRSFYYLGRWEWYEWLGVFAPLVLLYAFRRFLRRRTGIENGALLPLVSGLLYYGVFQTVVGLAVMFPSRLERLRPFEPMRYMHLLYLFFFLTVGGLLGQYVLRRHVYRWALLFLPLGAGMFYAQRQMYPATEHLELPGAVSRNAWVQAFTWIRQNTSPYSLFALDPHYVELPGEDFHGFRALAERSVLADYVKDGGMAARVPRLAPRWVKEVAAQTGWRNFQAADFQRLKNEFGVTWVILSRVDAASDPQNLPAGMTCPYQNQQVRVCRLY